MDISKLSVNVVSQTEHQLQAEISFPLSTGFFDGHFPDLPLLPGVIQTHLALRLFEKHQGVSIPISGFKSIKFFSPIFPEMTVLLICELDKIKKTFTFQYSDLKTQDLFSKGTAGVKDV